MHTETPTLVKVLNPREAQVLFFHKGSIIEGPGSALGSGFALLKVNEYSELNQ